MIEQATRGQIDTTLVTLHGALRRTERTQNKIDWTEILAPFRTIPAHCLLQTYQCILRRDTPYFAPGTFYNVRRVLSPALNACYSDEELVSALAHFSTTHPSHALGVADDIRHLGRNWCDEFRVSKGPGSLARPVFTTLFGRSVAAHSQYLAHQVACQCEAGSLDDAQCALALALSDDWTGTVDGLFETVTTLLPRLVTL
jgi:hypothetical protein